MAGRGSSPLCLPPSASTRTESSRAVLHCHGQELMPLQHISQRSPIFQCFPVCVCMFACESLPESFLSIILTLQAHFIQDSSGHQVPPLGTWPQSPRVPRAGLCLLRVPLELEDHGWIYVARILKGSGPCCLSLVAAAGPVVSFCTNERKGWGVQSRACAPIIPVFYPCHILGITGHGFGFLPSSFLTSPPPPMSL